MHLIDNRIQERLALLEAGEALETCLDGLPEDEALLIKKAALLRTMQKPGPTVQRVIVQRQEILQLAKERKNMMPHSSPNKRQSAWIWPLALAGGGIVILMFVTIFTILVSLAVLRWRNNNLKAAQNLPLETKKTLLPGARLEQPASTPENLNLSPELGSGAIEPPNAQSALLTETRGLVEVQEEPGTWKAAHNGMILQAGQSLRTGPLSRASLLFYDGSRANLESEAELRVDVLDAQRTGPRLIKLGQKIGESNHQVEHSSDPASIYEVTTPYGTGIAQGTVFHVAVFITRLVTFDVEEGVVDVTWREVTVHIAAGQSTIIIPSAPPTDPLYRLTGQGKVEQIGNWWHIAGDIFMANGHTRVVGSPQVGDWVSFEALIYPDGTRLLTRVSLLRRAPENRFTFNGKVEAIEAAQWTVAGQVIQLDNASDIDPGIQVGNQVEVEGRIAQDGTLWAERIRLIVEQPGPPFEFSGVVQGISATGWLISGINITVNPTTTIEAGITISDVVAVRGWTLADGTWLARQIQLARQDVPEFEIVGMVKSLSPWNVSGIEFATDENTRFDQMIQVGDRVRVKGIILEDGSWLAQDIQLLEVVENQDFHFVGFVTSLEPWIVNNIPLTVDETTEISENIMVGDLVWVQGVILPDGTWLAHKIQRLERSLGCLTQTTLVVSIDIDEIGVLDRHWGKIKKHGGLHVVGDVKEATVIILSGCVQEDGTFIVTQITAIYQFDRLPDMISPEDDHDDDHNDDHKHHDEDDHDD